MTICGGVLIPDGTRHCYVEERGITGPPWRLVFELDHITPLSMGGAKDGPTHMAHFYCQRVQGRLLQPREANVRGGTKTAGIHEARGYFQSEEFSAASRRGSLNQLREAKVRGGQAGGRNQPREAKVRGGMQGGRSQSLAKRKAGAENTRKARHTRWHVKRQIINPTCDLCIGGE
jgi:hypothetical protein